MLQVQIPGAEDFILNYLVLDFNGTIAVDGKLIERVRETIEKISEHLEIHVLTADTFGSVERELAGVPCRIAVIPPENQAVAKVEYVDELGFDNTVCVGNGRNDHLMLDEAIISIALIQAEGAASETIAAADVVCTDIISALELLMHPKRLSATLRL